EPETRVLPFHGVPDRTLACEQRDQSLAAGRRPARARAESPRLGRLARAGARPRSRQWRAGASRGLLPGLNGHPATARHGLWAAVRIRDVQAVDSGWMAAGATGQLAAARRSLGDRPSG